MGEDGSDDRAGQEREWLVEQRLRAVLEVLDGSPVGEVAVWYGVSRQSVYTWKARHAAGGIDGLREASRRPRPGLAQISRRWCASYGGCIRGGGRAGSPGSWRSGGWRGAPSRATVHRVLVRNAIVTPQAQRHKRKYRRWAEGDADGVVAAGSGRRGVLADGRECKLLSGIGDHSRYVVVAAVLGVPSGRAVADAFVAAMKRYGVPAEVLTDMAKTLPSPAQPPAAPSCAAPASPQPRSHRQPPARSASSAKSPATAASWSPASGCASIGATYAGKIVTVHVEDTHFRVTCDGAEISLHPRTERHPSPGGKPNPHPKTEPVSSNS